MGPNGSGKSNISDAVRWVLGEQSVKSLRGSKMNDVIFQGGENKNSLNMAEVNLTFSNEDHALDVEYDNVVISRRIYRDGENEYRINGKKTRLKDIKELFLDTGIGKEGYSLIGQGRIEQIISSSNQDRRAIFEEASGIAKHKYRRDEARKKLAKVTEDLETIKIDWEYKSRDLEKLKTEANNFDKWEKLTQDLNQKSYFYLKEKSKSLSQKKEEKTKALENIYASIRQKEEALKRHRASLGPVTAKYQDISEQIENLNDKKSKDLKNIETSTNQINLNQQKLEFSQKDLDRLENNLSLNTGKTENLSKKLSEDEASLKNKKEYISKLKADITEINREIEALNNEIEGLKKSINQNQETKSDLNRKIYDYELNSKTREILSEKNKEDYQKNQARIKEIDAEIEEINKNLKSISEEKIKLLSEQEKISNQIIEIESDLEDLSTELTDISREMNRNTIDLKSAINDYKINKDLLEKNEGYVYSVQDFINKTKEANISSLYEDTLANMISVKPGYEDIIDNLIGPGLQNIVTRTKDETRDLIKFVNHKNIGRVTFLPIDSVTSYKKDKPNHQEVIAMAYELLTFDEKIEKIINHFLGSTVVVEDIDKAISLSKKIRGYKIITLNLDVINSWGSMVAGSNKNKKSNTNLINRNKKLEEKQKLIKNLKAENLALTDTYANIEKEISTLKENLSTSKNLFDQSTEELNRVNAKILDINYKLKNLNDHKENLALAKDPEDILVDDTNMDEIYTKRDELEEILKESLKSLEEISLKNNQLNADLIKKQNDLEMTSRDINMLNNSIGQKKNDIANLEDSDTTDRSLRDEQKNLIAELTSENKKLDGLIDRLKISIESAYKSLEKLSKEKANIEIENQNLVASSKALEEDLQKLNLDLVKINYDLDSISKEYENLMDEIKPFISEDFTSLEERYLNEPITKVNKSDLISLQKSINNIGYFTPDSKKDYEQLNEEFSFVDGQVKDLKESKANIEKMIKALEVEMKDEFVVKFDMINKKFSHIFKTLFMGGDARLKLDSDDPLLAGVDIEARPPSKSLKSISLLSGGEKSLTAVALLFAIFETNPAPFAILDEIDAALDETNIKRYIEYLKTLSENSQFIMITHRQTAMQLAEEIHGITLGDDGVSRIYSIDFDEN